MTAPPFPKALIVCTVIIALVGFLINFFMATVNAELAAFALQGNVVLEEFYGKGTSAYSDATVSIATSIAQSSKVMFWVVNFVFSSAFFVSALMVIHSLVISKGITHKKLDEWFALSSVASESRKGMWRELYVSLPHLLSVGVFFLSMLLLVVVLLYYLVVSYVSPSAYTLWICALALVGLTITVRIYVTWDVYYLYSALLANTTDPYELIKGVPNGAVRCLVNFAIGMLLLDAPLFTAPAEFNSGLGLPADTEATFYDNFYFVFTVAKWFYVPICFVGAGSVIGLIRRGAWIAPEGKDCCQCCGLYLSKCNPARPCCGIVTEYKVMAAAAIKDGTWDAFKKERYKRRVIMEALSFGVFLGVILLIPIYTVVIGVTYSLSNTCDSLREAGTLPPMSFTQVADQTTPSILLAKSIAGQVYTGEPLTLPSSIVQYNAPDALSLSVLTAGFALPSLMKELDLSFIASWAATLDSYDIAAVIPATCYGGDGWPFDGGIHGLHFWVQSMLLGLFLHLPPAVLTWHLVNRYSTIMAVQNDMLEPPAARTSMV